MRRIRWIALGAAALVTVGMLAPVASAQGGDEKPNASDVGITADEIRVGVIAAIDVPGAPGLFQGMVDAVEAWAEWTNDNGGLAGRDVVVDTYDSKLSNDEAKNAVIEACSTDFALVGTGALFFDQGSVDELVNCRDKNGDATGIPDFPVVVSDPAQQCSPVSYAMNPPTLDCATKDDSPQTYRANTGPTSYYLKKNGGDLKGGFIYPADLKQAKDSQVPIFTAQEEKGIEQVYEADISARAQQSAYTSVAQNLQSNDATYARSGLDFNSTVLMRREANLQGVDSVKVWDCSLQCYTPQLVEQGGADVEDQYVYSSFIPKNETGTNKMVKDFVNAVGEENVDGFTYQAWAAGIYLRDLVEQVVDESGVNGVTRKAVLEQAPTITDFTAEGMLGETNVGGRVPSPCYVLMQVKDGDFVRVDPKKKGTFNCDKKNVVTLKLDLL